MDRPQNIKMLIVEDDLFIGRMIKDFFDSSGYEFLAAEGGQEAYNLCIKELPNVIVTDIMLPGMDGIELIKRLRALPEFGVTPIVAVTAGDSLIKDAARQAGAHLVLSKPVGKDELVEAVDNLLKSSPFIKR